MIRTQYASGRDKLPAPTITTTSGTIQGGNVSYYFWIKAKNRVGYNLESNPTVITLANNSGFIINSSNFNIYNYEDWREIIVCVSTVNNFNTSRVIYKQKLYSNDEIVLTNLSSIIINTDNVINGNYIITDFTSFPDTTSLPNGYRVSVNANNSVYEYIRDSTLVANNLTTFPAVNGIWSTVYSNTLTELTNTARKEKFEVTEDELTKSTLNLTLNSAASIKYYLYNDSNSNFSNGELYLSDYCSNPDIIYKFAVKILGYFNFTTNTLDTTGIAFINIDIEYPSIKPQLSKPLPANSALVIEVKPILTYSTPILENVFIAVYPKLNTYSTITDINSWGEPVADLTALRALPSSNYKPNQIRYVSSLNQAFGFNSNSTSLDDGVTVIVPNNNPITGRWLAISSSILNNSITLDKLTSDALNTLTPKILTTTLNITTATFTLDLDSNLYDYYIINVLSNDNMLFNINVTLENNSTISVILEIRQNSSSIIFDNSLLFPNGNIPVLSGNNKTDLFVVYINKDSNGNIKKRITLVQKNIG